MAVNSAISDNPAYTYSLFTSGGAAIDSVQVVGRLPQEWLVSVGSTWEGNASGDTSTELAQNFGGKIGQAASLVKTVGGNNVGFTALSNRQWTGGQPLTFNLLAEFNANTNVIEDVIRPALLLQAMSMPTTITTPSVDVAHGINLSASFGNVIGAPFWQNAADSKQVGGISLIHLRIGNMFIFDDIVVENVSITNVMRLTSPGLPIKVSCEIQASTRGPITFEQYVGYMRGPAMTAELFNGKDVISKARQNGPGQRASISNLKQAPIRQ